ncbi:MAG: hypothetical protein WCQ32_03265 [bacterium]
MGATASIPQQPIFVNLEYIFFLFYRATAGFFNYLFSENFFYLLKIIASLLVIALITGILYLLVLLYELQHPAGTKKVAAEEAVATTAGFDGAPVKNETWEHIRSRILSDNTSEWRIAIIEADIYLDKSLDLQGFYGDTLGDKLKKIKETQLPSIQLAWEGHKIRNLIAHEGAGYVLTQPEARRALSYYEIVFRDLGLID